MPAFRPVQLRASGERRRSRRRQARRPERSMRSRPFGSNLSRRQAASWFPRRRRFQSTRQFRRWTPHSSRWWHRNCPSSNRGRPRRRRYLRGRCQDRHRCHSGRGCCSTRRPKRTPDSLRGRYRWQRRCHSGRTRCSNPRPRSTLHLDRGCAAAKSNVRVMPTAASVPPAKIPFNTLLREWPPASIRDKLSNLLLSTRSLSIFPTIPLSSIPRSRLAVHTARGHRTGFVAHLFAHLST